MITADQARELLDYDPETGVFKWRFRPRSTFKSERAWKIRNVRYAGSAAGTTDRKGYIVIKIMGRLYRAHRLAWLYVHGVWPKNDIDHISMVKDDNRIANLREATRSQNNCNTGIRGDSTSGVKGVSWNARKGKWRADIVLHGRQHHIGYFDDIEDAKDARIAAAEKLHGEFANTGEMQCRT